MKNLWLFLVVLSTGFLTEKLVSSQSPFSTDDLYIEGLPIDDEDGEDDGSGSGSGSGSGYDELNTPDPDEFFRSYTDISSTSPLQPQPTADSAPNPPTTAATGQEASVTVKDNETTFPDGNGEDKEVPNVVPTADSFTPKKIPAPVSTVMTPKETTGGDIIVDILVTDEPDVDNSLERFNVATTKKDGPIKEMDNEIDSKSRRRGGIYDAISPEQVTSENLWERTEVLAAVIACGVVGFLCAVSLLVLLAYRMKKKDEGSYDLGDNKLSSTAYHKAPTKEFYA
ncbi:unnamed protein product [Ophioblennius macclurei]